MCTRRLPYPAAPPAALATSHANKNRRTFTLLLMTSAALLACQAAQAQFANFNDTNQWTLHTDGSGVTVQPSDDGTAIQFTWAADTPSDAGAYYQSTFKLSGNWTVEFNYSLDTWPADNGVFLGAGILPFVAIQRQSAGEYAGTECYNFVNGPNTEVSTTDMSGKMQYSLQGSTLTGSYWNAASNAWVVVGQAQGFTSPDGPWSSQGPFSLTILNAANPSSNNGQVVVDTISDVSIQPPLAPCTPHAAAATARLDDGFVVAATVTDAGCGYTNAPAVIIQGGGGSGATATAVVNNGVVTGITITDAGIGYTNVPTVYISAPLPPAVSLKKAVKPTFASLSPPFNYQLQVSTDLVTWTNQGAAFMATNSAMDYPQYFDVEDWNQLFFRLQMVQ